MEDYVRLRRGIENNMEWYQVLTIVGANLAMFFWLRTEANSDRRDMMNMIISFKDEIQKEMKDFHAKLALQDLEFKMRLSAIEERNRK